MNYSSDFFYNNKEYFKTILLRYERKATPKRKLICYLNINTITETSLKDVEPVFNNNIENIENSKENEIEDYLDLFDDKIINNEDENEFNFLNGNYEVFSNEKINEDDKFDYLCRKRHEHKYSDDDDGDKFDDLDINVVEPLNKKLNNYSKYYINNYNLLLKYKQQNNNGISLKETEEDYDDDNYYEI